MGAWAEGSFVVFYKYQETADVHLVAASRLLPSHCRRLPAVCAAACRSTAAACLLPACRLDGSAAVLRFDACAKIHWIEIIQNLLDRIMVLLS